MLGDVMTDSIEPVPDWRDRPRAQQPQWQRHPAFGSTMAKLGAAAPLVSLEETSALRTALAGAAAGRLRILQAGDCAESLHQCTAEQIDAKTAALAVLAQRMRVHTGAEVIRIGRIGGQFAKPRSAPTEQHEGRAIPSFRGHLINSEVPTRAARQHDPRRLLWAYQASRVAT